MALAKALTQVIPDGIWMTVEIRNGHAVTGTTVIDGVLYEFDGYGVWNLKS